MLWVGVIFRPDFYAGVKCPLVQPETRRAYLTIIFCEELMQWMCQADNWTTCIYQRSAMGDEVWGGLRNPSS